MLRTDNKTVGRPHPALLLFFFANGALTTIAGAALLYIGTHPPVGSRHGQPEAFLLGMVLLLVGGGLIAKGIAMVRGARAAYFLLYCVAAPPSLCAQELPAESRPLVVGPEQAVHSRRTRAREGAVVGFIVGTTVTLIVTRSGGSTAPCNRSANQDALSSGECVGLAVAGGLVGAGLGALIGSRMRVEVHNRAFLLVVSIGAPL